MIICRNSASRTGIWNRLGDVLRLFVLLLGPAAAESAQAHSLGESYIFLNIEGNAITGHVDLPITELNDVLFADEVNDGILTADEATANIERIVAYVSARVEIGTDEAQFPIRFIRHEIFGKPRPSFVQLFFTVDGLAAVPTELDVRYGILFDTHPLHRALLILENNEIAGSTNPVERASLIFAKDSQVQRLDLTKSSWANIFVLYFEHGVYHIAIGLDHILFLVALLLSAVLQREAGRWTACRSFRGAFLNVVTVVTLFTVAHSITLALAALEIVTLPSRFVESMIALTVIIAAVHNIFPLVEKRIASIVFLFGLLHGFGFAGVLGDLGFSQSSLIAPLLGFNLGVEFGQLILVGTLFPVLYLIRTHPIYANAGLRLGSAAIAVLGMAWFTERALGFVF